MDDAKQNAVIALREAAQALTVGDKASDGRPKMLEQNMPGLADEVATVLEAMVTLLHHVDLDPRPRSGAGHNLHAVTQHLSAGAQLARRVGATEEFDESPRSTQPETRTSPS
ncbi:hypothetical protein [Actinomycetospora atypica]|uniref:Uncharacterized protein n=1 Tax=Actinomycetospora atypica TaxID=1290095 RepID=A0ABV9YNR7_9PSEU